MKKHFGIKSLAIVAVGSLAAASAQAYTDDSANQPGGGAGDFGTAANFISSGVSACQGVLSDDIGSNELNTCIENHAIDKAANKLLNLAFDNAAKTGKTLFGEPFKINNRLNFSTTDNNKITGDLDVVIPLNYSRAEINGQKPQKQAFFIQQGVTKWQDDHDFRRSDMRMGGVYRFQLTEAAGGHIFGMAHFIQQNAERGHKRYVARYDYTGKWGESWINNYAPITEWLPGRVGFEERAVAGSEFGHKLHLTSTVSVDLTASKWEDKTGADRWVREQKTGLHWKPHPWWTFSTGVSEKTDKALENTLSVAMNVPLGRDKSRAPEGWKGLGVVGGGGNTVNSETLWQSVDNIAKIEVIEREVPLTAGDVSLRFLQDTVISGGRVGIEVSIPRTARRDLTVTLQLAPGDIAMPAVEGEDYESTPFTITIRSGEQKAAEMVDLLNNPNIAERRSIKLEVVDIS